MVTLTNGAFRQGPARLKAAATLGSLAFVLAFFLAFNQGLIGSFLRLR